MIRYQLSFFDTAKNARFKYLNGSSWPTEAAALQEYKLIIRDQKAKEKRLIYSSRIKWALEATKDGKKVLVKRLNNEQ